MQETNSYRIMSLMMVMMLMMMVMVMMLIQIVTVLRYVEKASLCGHGSFSKATVQE